jgi:hypothetical protein
MKTKRIVDERLNEMPDEIRITAPGSADLSPHEIFRPVRGNPDDLWVKLEDGWFHFTDGREGY